MHAFLLIASAVTAFAQQPVADPRQAAAQAANARAEQTRRAEDLLEHGDYAGAEPLLVQLAGTNPKDARILFDLGFTQEHNGHNEDALRSYSAAVAADGTLAEPRVALGLLHARQGQTEAAHGDLQAAAQLQGAAPELRGRALRALARLDQGAHPEAARTELAQAVQLTGEQPGDAELTAGLSSAAGNSAGAEEAFRSALARDPGDSAAAAELAALLQKQHKLAEADAVLTPALAAHPAEPRLVAEAASLYAAEGKSADALALLDKLRAADGQAAKDDNLTRLYAHLLLVNGDPARAEPLYRALSAQHPDDPSLLDDLGSTLVREQNFVEAQTVLSRAVGQRAAFGSDQAWGDAAGHLAFAASRNHQPQVALQALQARATVLPNSAATLFLEATSHDALHQKKEAERAYRAFLSLANGKLPDEEFEARHRLVALEHEH